MDRIFIAVVQVKTVPFITVYNIVYDLIPMTGHHIQTAVLICIDPVSGKNILI